MKPGPSVDSYLAALDPPARAAVDALRDLVMAAHPGLTEEIKWNAPSFAHAGQDRVTLGINPRGGYRVVLHRGAKPVNAAGFKFTDEARLASWPAPDRGVITLKDRAEIAAKGAAVTRLIARWIATTS